LNLAREIDDSQLSLLDDETLRPLVSHNEANSILWDQKRVEINEELSRRLDAKGLRSPTLAQLL
jgi:hypothetical protein